MFGKTMMRKQRKQRKKNEGTGDAGLCGEGAKKVTVTPRSC
jgi:hypothetical protein